MESVKVKVEIEMMNYDQPNKKWVKSIKFLPISVPLSEMPSEIPEIAFRISRNYWHKQYFSLSYIEYKGTSLLKEKLDSPDWWDGISYKTCLKAIKNYTKSVLWNRRQYELVLKLQQLENENKKEFERISKTEKEAYAEFLKQKMMKEWDAGLVVVPEYSENENFDTMPFSVYKKDKPKKELNLKIEAKLNRTKEAESADCILDFEGKLYNFKINVFHEGSGTLLYAMWRDYKGDYAEPEILLRNAAYKIANNIIEAIKGAKNA